MNQKKQKERPVIYKTHISQKKLEILTVFMLAALLAIGCMVKNHTEETDGQIQKELQDISGYLTGVDENVIENQKKIQEVIAGSKDDFQTIQSSLSEFKKFLADNQELIQKYYTEDEKKNQVINENLSLIQNQFTAATEQINIVENHITDLLKEDIFRQQEKYVMLDTKLTEINTSIEQSNQSILEVQNSILSTLEILEKENDSRQETLVSMLTETNEMITNRLDALEESITTYLDLMADGLYVKLKDIHEQINTTQTDITEILASMKEQDLKNQEDITSRIEMVNAAIQQINKDLEESHVQIKQLIAKLSAQENENHSETLHVLQDMEGNIKEDMVGVDALFQDMSRSMEDNFANLNDSITQNFTETQNLSKQENENHTALLNLLDLLKTDIQNNLSQGFTNLNDGIIQMLAKTNIQIKDECTNLSAVFANKDEALRGYLEEKLNHLDQRLDSVFQYVSNGKRKLASALLTKGVTIKEDATFAQIQDAILSIPQELTEMPGTITYECHYHTDGAGNEPRTERVTPDKKGGCFGNPVYHIHTGDALKGGGCYTVPISHTHTDSCFTVTRTVRKVTGYWFTGEGTGHGCCDSAHGQGWVKYKYREEVYKDDVLISSNEGEGDLGYCCGLCVADKASKEIRDSTETSVICGYSEGVIVYEPGCKMTADSVVAYTATCGYSDGQIVAAHIKYK